MAIGQGGDEARWTGHARHHRARAGVDVVALHVRDVTSADVTAADDVDAAPVRERRRRLDAGRQAPDVASRRAERGVRRAHVEHLQASVHAAAPSRGLC